MEEESQKSILNLKIPLRIPYSIVRRRFVVARGPNFRATKRASTQGPGLKGDECDNNFPAHIGSNKID